MNISERKRGDRQRLARMIARESNAMQRDRLRSVLLVLQGRQTLEVTATVGRSRAFVQRWAYAYRDGGIEAVQGRTPPGRPPRLSPDQETRFVQRVKAGATPRDGVASLRGPQIQGILDREFGRRSPSMGSTSCSSGTDSCALSPGRGIHSRIRPQRKPSSGAPPFCESRAGFTASHESSRLVPGRGEGRPAGHTHRGLGDQGIAADRRPSEWPQVDLGIRGRRARHGLVSGRAVP